MATPFEQSISGGDVSIPTDTDLSGKQYYFVDVDSAGKAVLASAEGQDCVGVNQGKTNGSTYPGIAASVRTVGVTKVYAAETIAPGDRVKASSAGKAKVAVPATTDASGSSATAALVGSNVMGVCLVGADADGLITMLIQKQGAIPTTKA